MSKKKDAPKPEKATSAFSGVKQTNVDLGGLFNANAAKNKGSLDVTTGLGGGLQPIQANALAGIGSSQQELNISNADQLNRIDQGLNSTYNLLNEVNQRNADKALASAQSRYSLNGLENSTVRGAGEMQLANDAILRDLVARQQAIEANRNAALSTLNAQQGVLGGLVAGQQYAGNLGTQNLLTALNDQTAVSQFNAQQANQMAMAQYQQQMQQPSVWGSVANAGLGLAGAALGGPIGGMIGSAAGNALQGLFNPAPAPVAAVVPPSFVTSGVGGFGA